LQLDFGVENASICELVQRRRLKVSSTRLYCAHKGTKTKKFHLFGHLRIEKESESICTESHLMSFEYSTLKKATNNFNESCKLGVGGYGEVFKVSLFSV